jgi:hypothetical protein
MVPKRRMLFSQADVVVTQLITANELSAGS